MCGFVGVANRTGTPVSAGLLRRMADCIMHRGPDGDGYYVRNKIIIVPMGGVVKPGTVV